MRIFSENYIICSRVGRHAWYETDLGFRVRKPIGFVQPSLLSSFFAPTKMIKKSLWKRFVDYIKNLFT